jgi:endonuclease IV
MEALHKIIRKHSVGLKEMGGKGTGLQSESGQINWVTDGSVAVDGRRVGRV